MIVVSAGTGKFGNEKMTKIVGTNVGRRGDRAMPFVAVEISAVRKNMDLIMSRHDLQLYNS